ncbi:RadC family protein [Candidatus Magnetominusculus xianensis]|uniref:DNA repair protein RadC n=1 Tax=Candidatus Magnetominusculus xianensis TaxID=1748249 RepID=A0ABR5SDA3_9BACT|nr:DNA repair protein RadC [Candidatus Magnetominusculus xianensis]KWT82919.1 DNA repair protein RadC [Candidatus Magnetominusculus xianensis]MBF0405321.1 DNA repair protein RadC [Nitrospirota bacterium]
MNIKSDIKSDNGKSSKPQYTGHRMRLRQRYIEKGVSSLAGYEVIELLLTFTRSQKDVKPEAKRLLKRFGSIQNILDADKDTLMEVEGIGLQTATLIKLVKDLGTIYLKQKRIKRKAIKNPDDIVDYLRTSIGSKENEQFLVLYLNAKNEVMAEEIIGEGIPNLCYVYPRKIFEHALKHNATALILVHNHPTGSPSPSEDDIKLTRSLKETASRLGIVIHDHLIVTRHSFFSFIDRGLL